jgi:hypothetical protein
LQDPSEINLNNVRCEGSIYFRNKKKENLKEKINELSTNSKNKNIRDLYRGINKFKRDYQLRNNLVKDENGDLLADSNNILNRWKNYYSLLLNVHNASESSGLSSSAQLHRVSYSTSDLTDQAGHFHTKVM